MSAMCQDRRVADPVSWLMIRPGWKVYAADGGEVGEVDEVAGDESHDIFDGLAVATSALARPRYVPSEQVAQIVEGEVHLSLTQDEVGHLVEYREPATSAEIEPESKGGILEGLTADTREIEAKALGYTPSPEEPVTIWRRVALLFRRRG
jgi:hypothetical protein